MINKKNEYPIPKFSLEVINEQISIFTGKYNLSLDVLCLSDFYNLAINLIALGLINSKNFKYDPLKEAKSLLKQIKRNKLKNILVNIAFKKHRQIMTNFKKQKYVCLSWDEGKTEGYQNLHFVLEFWFGFISLWQNSYERRNSYSLCWSHNGGLSIDQVLDISVKMSALFLDPILMMNEGKENNSEKEEEDGIDL